MFASVSRMGRLPGFDDSALEEQLILTYVRAVAYAATCQKWWLEEPSGISRV